MLARLGIVIYWIGAALAVLILGLGAVILFGDKPILSLITVVAAGISWFVGWMARYILAGY